MNPFDTLLGSASPIPPLLLLPGLLPPPRPGHRNRQRHHASIFMDNDEWCPVSGNVGNLQNGSQLRRETEFGL